MVLPIFQSPTMRVLLFEARDVSSSRKTLSELIRESLREFKTILVENETALPFEAVIPITFKIPLIKKHGAFLSLQANYYL